MNKKNQSGNAHVIIIIVLVVVLLGALGFIFYQNFMKEKPESKSTTTTATTVVVTELPTAETIANIKAAVTSKNTAVFEGYLADTLSVIPVPGGCLADSPTPTSCFEKTKIQAIETLSTWVSGKWGGYPEVLITSAEWTFDVSAEELTALKSSNEFLTQYIDEKNAVVGVSVVSNQAIIFNFDNSGMIDTILLLFPYDYSV